MSIRHTMIETELGQITLVADEERLTGLYFARHRHLPMRRIYGAHVEGAADPVLSEATTQLKEYLAGTRRSFDVPVATLGDEFEERVWGLLTQIPFGDRVSYGSLAEQLGDKTLAQRVGQAVGRNPLCVIIPCHRVVGADGKLTGYAGGLKRKQKLLELEEPDEIKAGRLF